QVNPNMPRTRGNCWLHATQVDAWVEIDEPLVEYPAPVVGDVERAIGRHVAGLVPDGATVQVGVGAIPQAVLEALSGHRDLALHSLLVDPGVALIEGGVAGGASIIALPSTGRQGAVSRIVPHLATGAAVTTPRYLADWVVTEHGAAQLRGLSDRARATALITVAHPRFRGELERALATS